MNNSSAPETILRLFDGVYPSFAMLAGIELGIFTLIDNKSQNAKQIADILNVNHEKLRPLLYALVVAGLLDVENEFFSNTSESSEYLVQGKHTYLGDIQKLTASNWAKILKTASTIRAGHTLEKYDYHDMPQSELEVILRGLSPHAITDAHRLMGYYDFSSYGTLLDVGGGSGALTIAVVKANSHLHGTVIDLPLVTPLTQQFVNEANLEERIEVITGDAVHDTLIGTYDVIVARHVLQVLSADDNRSLLHNLATILKPGGILHLIGWILDNSRLTPIKTVNHNLILINGYDYGQAYTEAEYQTWLDEAGFDMIDRIVFSDGSSILSALKPT